FAVAKRVRTETDVARHAVSVSFAAVELAKKIFAGLDGRTVLLVGAGEMGELAARHLVEQGAFPIYVANRTWARAQELARALDGLKQVVDANLRGREREAQRAEAIVRHEVERFVTGRLDQEVVPTIVSLRTRLEAIRQAELEKALAKLPDASPETRQTLEALSTAIVNKILHVPIAKLRESSRAGQGGSWTAFVHELFGLRRDAP